MRGAQGLRPVRIGSRADEDRRIDPEGGGGPDYGPDVAGVLHLLEDDGGADRTAAFRDAARKQKLRLPLGDIIEQIGGDADELCSSGLRRGVARKDDGIDREPGAERLAEELFPAAEHQPLGRAEPRVRSETAKEADGRI